jgi:phosphate transport system permease protein
MHSLLLLLLILLIGAGGFVFGKRRVLALLSEKNAPRAAALPSYYGWCALLWTTVPALLLIQFYFAVAHPEAPKAIAYALAACLALLGLGFSLKKLNLAFRARDHVEKWVMLLMRTATFFAVSITLFIVLSVVFESVRFFEKVSIFSFLFGLEWSPQMALRADQAGSSGSFGAVPVFLGTIMITFIAMLVAAPVGLMSAIYLSEYASKRARTIIKPFLEILAGIPTVVYGYFAAIVFAPALRDFGASIGLNIASESALAAGVVMGIMIIPFILSLSDDVMNAVPTALKDASLGLGATRSETVVKVVVPAALPGIVGALLLAISRGIGETMIVVMAAGLVANLTINPFDSVTTVTAQIVTLLVGDQEFDSAKTLAAFALGFTLFLITLVLNVAALLIVRKYRERYE